MNKSHRLLKEFSVLFFLQNESMKVIAFFSVLVLLVSCGADPEKMTVNEQTISASVYASGTLKSKDQYQLYPLVSGVIQEVLVDDGDLVKKGQIIMRIENKAQQISAENAALVASYNDLAANQDKLNDAKDAIDLSKDKLKTDSLLYVRTKNLYSQGVGTKVELEQRELAFQSSKNSYQNAITRYRDLKRQLDLNAKQANNNYAISSKMAGDYLIKSDIEGKVYAVLRDKGELVSPQIPVATIGSANNYVLEMQVDEYDIAKIDLGQKVYITMDSYKGKVYEAKISKINPIMNERSKTFIVEAVFTKAPNKLFPNTSFEASIVLQAKSKALVIPKRFLLQGDYVMLADGTKQKIEIGIRDYEYVEVVKGLKKGDEIILVE